MGKTLYALFYIALFVVLLLGGFLLYFFRGQPALQLWVVIGAAIFYIVWGAAHHILEDEFDWEVLLDYLLIAGLVIVIFLLAVRY
ncbi:MAG: hypothetical protein U9M98_02640 [Patescibacteria group bacterium]|nr:hypothetical protein [Patescibacteria group bacterium]